MQGGTAVQFIGRMEMEEDEETAVYFHRHLDENGWAAFAELTQWDKSMMHYDAGMLEIGALTKVMVTSIRLLRSGGQ